MRSDARSTVHLPQHHQHRHRRERLGAFAAQGTRRHRPAGRFWIRPHAASARRQFRRTAATRCWRPASSYSLSRDRPSLFPARSISAQRRADHLAGARGGQDREPERFPSTLALVPSRDRPESEHFSPVAAGRRDTTAPHLRPLSGQQLAQVALPPGRVLTVAHLPGRGPVQHRLHPRRARAPPSLASCARGGRSPYRCCRGWSCSRIFSTRSVSTSCTASSPTIGYA